MDDGLHGQDGRRMGGELDYERKGKLRRNEMEGGWKKSLEKLLESDSFACHAMVAQFLFFIVTSLWVLRKDDRVLRTFDRREASAYGSDTYK